MELIKSKQGFTVLNDAYNASPASVVAALKTLQALAGYDRKIVVLGNMLELGDYAPKAHRDIGSAIARGGVSKLVAVGELAADIIEGAKSAGFPEENIEWYPDSASAAADLKSQVKGGDAVLVKGSRAMKMEEIVRILLSE
jgi:UDP-N-acetylmuramoyl-tripeptide--D-alanyl-D-alanine ligase